MSPSHQPAVRALILAGPTDSAITCAPENAKRFHALISEYCSHAEPILQVGRFETGDILKALDAAESEQAILLFFFSGHGFVRDGSSPEINPYHICSGDDHFDLNHLILLINSRRQIVHTYVILDCCYAGIFQELVSRNKLERRVSVLASCGANERSYQPAGSQFSAFTKTISFAFEQCARDVTGIFTLGNVAEIVIRDCTQKSQTPEFHHANKSQELRFSRPVVKVRQASLKNILENNAVSSEASLLLHADEIWRRLNENQETDRAVFELSSGFYAKSFISIWELFDSESLLQECIDWYAETVRAAFEERRIRCILTCTDPALEVSKHVRRKLQKQGLDLPVCHLGYPPRFKDLDFTSQWLVQCGCVVLTDVVSSGNLARKVIREVRAGEGNVCAVIALALTHAGTIDHARATGKLVGTEVDILRFAEHPIPTIPEAPLQEYIIPIDHVLVFPEPKNAKHINKDPLVSRMDMINQLSKAGAITAGLYLYDDHIALSRVDFDALLNSSEVRQKIWKCIKVWLDVEIPDHVAHPIMLMTTYKHSDLIFKNFIQENLTKEGEHQAVECITIKRQTKDNRVIFQSFYGKKPDLGGKNVIVAIGSSSSSEKIRAIAGFLSVQKPARVCIILLVNRGGICSFEFLSTISTLEQVQLKDSSPSKGAVKASPQKIGFHFASVYNLRDSDSAKISDAVDEIRFVLEDFSQSTDLLPFRRYTEELIASEYVAASAETPSTQDQISNDHSLTADADLVNALYEYGENEKTTRIGRPLVDAKSARAVRILLIALMGDIAKFQLSRNLDKLLEDLWQRIQKVRVDRFAVEPKVGADNPANRHTIFRGGLDELLDLEFALIEAFVILLRSTSKLPSGFRPQELLTCGRVPKQWRKTPFNLVAWFGRSRSCYYYFLSRHIISNRLPEERERLQESDSQVVSFLKSLRDLGNNARGHIEIVRDGNVPRYLIEGVIDELEMGQSKSFSKLADRVAGLLTHNQAEEWVSSFCLVLSTWRGVQKSPDTAFAEFLYALRECGRAQAELFGLSTWMRRALHFNRGHYSPLRYSAGTRHRGLLQDLNQTDRYVREAQRVGAFPPGRFEEFENIVMELKKDFGPQGQFSELLKRWHPLLKDLVDQAKNTVESLLAVAQKPPLCVSFTDRSEAFLHQVRILIDELHGRELFSRVLSWFEDQRLSIDCEHFHCDEYIQYGHVKVTFSGSAPPSTTTPSMDSLLTEILPDYHASLNVTQEAGRLVVVINMLGLKTVH